MRKAVTCVDIKLPTPPMLSGSTEEQVRQLWSYLFQVVNLVNAKSGGNKDVRKTT